MVITKMYDISIDNAAKIIFMEVTIARNGVPPIATIVGRFNLIGFDSIDFPQIIRTENSFG